MTTTLSSRTPHQAIMTRLGSQTQVLSRSELLAWEARRAVKQLRWLGAVIPDGDVETLREAVVATKLCLGRVEIERRLARQVKWSDRISRVIALASGGRRRLCQAELFVPRGTALALPTWYMDRAEIDDESAFLLACPDHHLFRLTSDRRQEVWETTGGSPLASRFFFTADETDCLVTPQDPSYPVQMAGTARLADGTIIGGIRHQFRNEGEGMRALLTVELPWLMGPMAVAAHRWHLASEFSWWAERANANP